MSQFWKRRLICCLGSNTNQAKVTPVFISSIWSQTCSLYYAGMKAYNHCGRLMTFVLDHYLLLSETRTRHLRQQVTFDCRHLPSVNKKLFSDTLTEIFFLVNVKRAMATSWAALWGVSYVFANGDMKITDYIHLISLQNACFNEISVLIKI